jgi:hypothetical protein
MFKNRNLHKHAATRMKKNESDKEKHKIIDEVLETFKKQKKN